MRIGSTGEIKLKIIIVTVMLLLVFSSYGLAEEGDTLWTRVYGDTAGQMANSVVQTSDGGYAVAGLAGGFDTGDFWLIKIDANGDTLWTRTYGTADNEQAQSVKQTYDGGYILAGWVSEDTSGFWVYNLYVVRTDANGDTLWTWRYAGHDYAYAYDVEQTPDSGYVIVGKTGQLLMDYNAYLIRLNSNGDTLWTRVYGDPDHQEGYDVELTSDGGYVITGLTGSCPDYDVFLIKTDANGDSLWGHTYGYYLVDTGFSVKATSDGGFIIAGCTEWTTPGTLDAYFIKTDSTGDTLWTRKYGGPYTDEAYSIYQTIGGNYIATGYYGPTDRDTDLYVLKLDTNGDTLWTRLYGGGSWDRGNSVIQAADGSYLVAGGSSSFGTGPYDVYLLNLAGPEIFGSIAGYVSDEIERAPIESVYVSADQYETWSDQYGYYSLSNMLAANYDVSFSHPDYQDTTVTGVIVTVGNTTSLDVQMTTAGGCDYVVGDVNGSDSYNGLDITYGVAFFKGGSDPLCPYGSCPIPPCDAFFYCGDVNGSCSYNGLDITYGVAYFKGGPDPMPCADCPPAEIVTISRDEMSGN